MKSSTGQGRKTAVLDTNIIVSALIAREGAPARVFELLILGRVENYTTQEIIRELKEVLDREEIASRTAKKSREFVLRQYLNRSIQVSAKTRVHAAEHAADNKFLEAALEGEAKYIITGDRHLLSLHEFRGIKIIRAKEFLEK